jgi:flagellar hook-associated protein 2
MGQVQAGVGLVSGMNITGMVTALMAINQEPVTQLQNTVTTLQSEQTALTALNAQLTALQGTTDSLGQVSLFQDQTFQSSDPTALTATATASGTPANGTYEFTPLQTASSAQWISNGLASATATLGAGSLSFRYGATVQRSAPLSELDGGQGLTPGEIRITDRSGESAVIDLSAAQNIDDVVNDINSAQGIQVTASVQGDHLLLTDDTGITSGSNSLQVQEVGNGTTAAALGLAGVAADGSTLTGNDVVQLTAATPLADLNDGNGVELSTVSADIGYTLANGNTGEIDLTPSSGAQPMTLGDILNEINAADPGKLVAQIGADGKSIEVTDTTSGSDTFELTSQAGSNALADLGLSNVTPATTDSGTTIAGRDLLGGLNSVLLSSLNGGQGYGTLGALSITDRSDNTATVNLSGAQTLQDVITAINSAGIGVSAAVNQAGDGIEITDTTGKTTGNLIIANADSSDAATKLGIAVNSAVSSVNSGNMNLKVISANTELSTLNGGAGVALGTFTITDSDGNKGTVNLAQTGINTVGDVIRAINRLGIKVHASLNSTGDGIVIEDTANNASGDLSVQEGSSTTAADLHLLGGTKTVGGTQEVNGATTTTIPVTSTDTLQSLVTKINKAGGGLTASIFNDGSADSNRLELSSSQTGAAGQMMIDTSALSALSLSQTVQAQDAVLQVGGSGSGAGILTTSSNNVFTGVLQGASLTVSQASSQPVTITIENSDTSLVTALQSMVTEYNSFQSTLTTDTAYNTANNTGAVLTANPTAINLGLQLSNALSNNFFGAGSVESLGQLGVTFNTDGTLAFDQSQFESAYSADPSAVQQFFTQSKTGFSAQVHNLLTNLGGPNTSMLADGVSALGSTISDDQTRITQLNSSLDQEQQNLYEQFDAMEAAISKIQSEMQVVNTIEPLDTSSSSTSSSSSSSGGTLSSLSSLG